MPIMAELKTRKTPASVDAFLATVQDEGRREDCRAVMKIMKRVTKADPTMWGTSIVGFGDHHYRYASGREVDWFLTGFSPRKSNLTLYIMAGFDRYPALVRRLGQVTTGRSCLYIRRLADVDLAALEELVSESVKHMKAAR
jgi:hypothetical protein